MTNDDYELMEDHKSWEQSDWFDRYIAAHDLRKLPEKDRWAVLLHPNAFEKVQLFKRFRRKHRKHPNL